MQVLRGRELLTIEPDEVDSRCETAERVVTDVGTGDARWAYRLARAHPSWLVVGLDPARERLHDMARRLARKPAKGGLDNLWLVVADVERAPAELHGRAATVHVLLPWGSLLRGAVLGECKLLTAVAALAQPGGEVELVLGANICDEPVPVDVRDLPTVDLAYVNDTLTARYAAAGLRIEQATALPEDEWRALPSSWARRLAHGRREPKFVRIVAHVDSSVSHRPRS
ncbi:MAG: rRNA methyltransferase [Actinobacteria bacterium]|nr:rRNA methyltransferase [Actinomycetota bacterium]